MPAMKTNNIFCGDSITQNRPDGLDPENGCANQGGPGWRPANRPRARAREDSHEKNRIFPPPVFNPTVIYPPGLNCRSGNQCLTSPPRQPHSPGTGSTP